MPVVRIARRKHAWPMTTHSIAPGGRTSGNVLISPRRLSTRDRCDRRRRGGPVQLFTGRRGVVGAPSGGDVIGPEARERRRDVEPARAPRGGGAHPPAAGFVAQQFL